MKELKEHISQIQRLCDRYNIKALFAFGSVTNDKFNADSDIDLLVDIDIDDPIEYADNYFGFKFQLQELFNRELDVLEQKAITNPLLRQKIDQSKVLVYAR